MLKNIIKKGFNKLGYEIRKLPGDKSDKELYLSLYGEKDIEKRNFYNIGAGLFKHPFWTNVDYYSDWYKKNKIDIHYDLLELKPLPVDTGSANIVYSSHTLEHITDEAARNMLNESYRILKPGGGVRITLPNIDLYYQALIYDDINFWSWEIKTYSNPKEMERINICKPMKDVSIKLLFLNSFATQVSELHGDPDTYTINDEEFDKILKDLCYEDMLNYCTSKCLIEIQKKNPGNHINWWNKNKLFRMLESAGFENIYLSGYCQSAFPVLRNVLYFDNTHFKRTIYVEAQKL